MAKPIRVLMTGGGAPGAPGIIRCLKADVDVILFVGDANPTAFGKFLNDKFVVLPKATEGVFTDFVLNYCVENDINVVFPLVTLELFRFAEVKDIFEAKGIKIIVSERESLEIANNKSRLYEHLKRKGILTPNFEVVKRGDFEGLLSAFKNLNYPNQPIVVKPSVSNGSRGVRIVNDSIDKLNLLFNFKPNSLYISFVELSEILRGSDFPELLVSEYLPDEEYTVDTIVENGKPKIILPRWRKKTNGGISVEGQFIENQEIIEYCRQIINSLNLDGPIGIQVKKGLDGRFKILEINPRIQGTSVAAMGLGINLPLSIVHQIVGKPTIFPEIKWGLSFSRFYDEVYY